MASAAPSLNPPRTPGAPSPAPHAVQSPAPHRPGLPGANSEPTAALHHFLSRGLYPNPGYYDGMRRQNPAIDSALTQKFYRRQAKPYRCLSPKALTPQAEDRAGRVREQLVSTHDGINGLAAEFGDRADQYGAGIGERVVEVDPATGEVRLADVVWVESWQLWRFWLDGRGFPIAVQLKGASALSDPIPFDVFAVFARRGNSRLPEGHSALRCLWWRTEDLRLMLVNAAKHRDRSGTPKRRYRVPLAEIDSRELRAAIHANEAMLTGTEHTYSVEPMEVAVIEDEGPRTPAGYREAIQAHEHSIARQLGDTLNEEGVAVAGARAAVVEQRKSAELSDLGQDLAIANAITRRLIWPIYDANGWPRAEAPYVHVTGWPDTDAWRALVELMRLDQAMAAGQAPPTPGVSGQPPGRGFLTPDDYVNIRGMASLDFGWEQDHA